jgi:CheY-like chemotaxis protein
LPSYEADDLVLMIFGPQVAKRMDSPSRSPSCRCPTAVPCWMIKDSSLTRSRPEPGFLLAAMRPANCACDLTAVTLRCLIVDDNTAFLKTIADLLQREGVTVVGVALTSADALAQAQELRPDVVLVDIMLGQESGFDVAQSLADMDSGDFDVILISTHAETDFAELIEEAPVAGFIPKSELSAEAIRRIMKH